MEKVKEFICRLQGFEMPIQLQIAWQIGRIWLFNILVSLDQLLNVIFWGDPDETISSRAGKARVEGRCWGCCLCGILDALDKRHCHKSLEYDEGKNSVMAIWQRRQKEGAS